MRIIFLLVVSMHGLIHLLGFVQAFNLASIKQLIQDVSKVNGVFWFVTSILLVASALLFYLKRDFWWIFAASGIIISQYLIFISWHDAKYGTIVNGVILLATIIGFGEWNFSRLYQSEVDEGLTRSSISEEILSEADIDHLPEPVKKYIHYTGSIGRPKIQNFKVEFSGGFRQSEKTGWMPFTSAQYNFIQSCTRLFFMKAIMKRLPVVGFHRFKDGKASMDIRLLSLFTVQYHAGEKMNISETVTFFNDMCVMAPATLIDKRIKWLETEGNTVDAAFTNGNITISARLSFNDKGELINFISKDRFAVTDRGGIVKTPWSTPLKAYKEINGYKLASYGEAIYNFPEGDFCYGKFNLGGVQYNVRENEQTR